MSFKLRLIPAAAAACVIAACGGGDAGAPPGAEVPAAGTTSTGVAVDGYIQAGTVLCDSNGNGKADAGEATTTSGSDGRFTFSPACSAALVVYHGTNADTGQPFRGVLKAPAGASVVSPLTSLVAAGMTVPQVIATLGLPATTDLLNTDPAQRTDGALVNAELLKKTLAVQQLLQKTTEVLARLGNATETTAQQSIYAEVAAAYGVLLAGGGNLSTGTAVDSSLVANLVRAAVDRVAAAAGVPAAVRTAVAAVNGQSLGVVTAGALAFQAEALLKAADASVVAVTKTQQADTAIATFIAANAGALAAAPGTGASALGDALTAQVSGTGGGDTGGGNPGGGGNTGGGDTGSGAGSAPTIDFSGAATGLLAFGSDGGGYAIIEADPTNAANKVAKIVKRPGDKVWAGATVYNDLANSTIAPVVLSAASKTITVRVYSPAVGEKVLLKLEQGDSGAPDLEVEATTTQANAWETLTLTFTATGTYRKLSLFPHFNTAAPSELAFYFDDLTYPVAAGGGGGTVDPVLPPVLDFAGTAAGLTAFGSDGGGYAAIDADPTDAANKVGKIVKRPGDQTWAGATVYADQAATSIPPVVLTSASRTIRVRVYAPVAGAKVLLKLEGGVNGAADAQVEATTTQANAWQTLSFTFPAAGTYGKLSLFPSFDTAVSAEQVFYFDDIAYPTAGTAAPTNYLALAANAISLVTGSSVTSYTLAQFQSDAGISVPWPLSSTTLLRVAVAEVGTAALADGQTLSAAVAINETTATGKGELLGYISNVTVSKTAQGLTIAVPASGVEALVYGVSSDARKKAVIDFVGSVAGVRNTLRLGAANLNDIVFGSVVNYGINQVSNDFTGIYGLRGKYKVSVVVNGLPLRQADGSALPQVSITVPTALNQTGGTTASKTVSGPGLVGYITLTN